jgi:hypothetical protein
VSCRAEFQVAAFEIQVADGVPDVASGGWHVAQASLPAGSGSIPASRICDVPPGKLGQGCPSHPHAGSLRYNAVRVPNLPDREWSLTRSAPPDLTTRNLSPIAVSFPALRMRTSALPIAARSADQPRPERRRLVGLKLTYNTPWKDKVTLSFATCYDEREAVEWRCNQRGP